MTDIHADTQLTDLIRAVEEADSAPTLARAVRHLALAQQVGAIPILIETLGYNNPGAAVAAVDGLVVLGEPAVEPLLQQLDSRNYTARAWAVRALAGIGDPRGLAILLETLETDFAMSVRRAAARGLGNIRWHQMPSDQVAAGQKAALKALLEASQDSEWIVRYAAVTALQSLAIALYTPDANPAKAELWEAIQQMCDRLILKDDSLVVRGRAQYALKMILLAQGQGENADWYTTLERLYHRKAEERPVAEGDPRKFRAAAAAITLGQPLD